MGGDRTGDALPELPRSFFNHLKFNFIFATKTRASSSDIASAASGAYHNAPLFPSHSGKAKIKIAFAKVRLPATKFACNVRSVENKLSHLNNLHCKSSDKCPDCSTNKSQSQPLFRFCFMSKIPAAQQAVIASDKE